MRPLASSQTLSVWSYDAEIMYRPSAVTAHEVTPEVSPWSVATARPLASSNTYT